jgi:uncharacterized protein
VTVLDGGHPPKLLALDGGGVRGLIPAMILSEIEQRTGKRTAELFDLIAGTSTGGIITAFLALPAKDGRPGRPAHEVVDFYIQEIPKIFHRSLARKLETIEGILHEKFDAAQLEQSLRTYIGEREMLSDAVTEVLIPAYDLEAHEPFFFRSSGARADPEGDYPMWVAARATAAAPTFFEPMPVRSQNGKRRFSLVDGGVYVNNPAACAYAEVCSGKARHALLVSMGTGRRTMPVTHDEVKEWGLARWARPLLNVVFDGVSDVVDYQLDQFLGDHHVRFQSMLTTASVAFDDASPENLERLKDEGRQVIAEQNGEIERVCEILVAESTVR